MAGRHSAAELATPFVLVPVARPEPPGDLSSEEAAEWRAIVDRMPADWFTRETHGILEQLCRHLVYERDLAKRHRRAKVLADKILIAREQREEARIIVRLQTSMRLTQHSRHDPKKNAGTDQKRPWEKRA